MLSAVNEYQGLRHIIEETATLKARKEALEATQDFILIAFHYSQRKRGAKWRPSLLLSNQHIFPRICLDFTANKFYVILFGLFEALFTIFTLFVLANRPLFIFNEDRLYSLSIVSELTCARWHYPCCDQTVQICSRRGMKASVATTEASASQRSATCRPHLSTKIEIKSKQILKVKVSPIGNPFSLFCWSNSVSFS